MEGFSRITALSVIIMMLVMIFLTGTALVWLIIDIAQAT